jgi:hypothetical protein
MLIWRYSRLTNSPPEAPSITPAVTPYAKADERVVSGAGAVPCQWPGLEPKHPHLALVASHRRSTGHGCRRFRTLQILPACLLLGFEDDRPAQLRRQRLLGERYGDPPRHGLDLLWRAGLRSCFGCADGGKDGGRKHPERKAEHVLGEQSRAAGQHLANTPRGGSGTRLGRLGPAAFFAADGAHDPEAGVGSQRRGGRREVDLRAWRRRQECQPPSRR